MADDLFQKLKEKYVSVLSVLNREHIHVQNMNLEGNKLLIRGEAPSTEASNHFWDAVKKVDPNYAGDLNAQITIKPQQASAPPAAAAPAPQATPVSGGQTQAQTYTVTKGDTLSKISKQFYGNPNEYMRIFEANRDQLKDPDKIQIGQVLKIPPKPASA